MAQESAVKLCIQEKLCPVHRAFFAMSGRNALPLIHEKTVDEWGTDLFRSAPLSSHPFGLSVLLRSVR